jgi:flagellar M-ring protein FliF
MASENNLKYLDTAKGLLQMPMVRQLLFMLGISASVAVGIVLYMSIQEPIYRPLDYQITSQNMSAIIDTLDKAGIQYKMNEKDGIIYVAAKDIQQARLKLSAAGVAKDDSFNFSYLNDQNNIGSSQFMENARYLRALEGDLSKTISAIQGISAARVHIAIPQDNIFADENRRPTASIVINIAPGLSSDKDKIRSIVQIVASSVPGLDPKNVAITDQYGHYLTGALNEDSIYDAEQLNYQNNVQSYYEKRIESMITPLIGENKVSVRVYANLDFSEHEEASEAYDPDKKVVRSEQTLTEQNSAQAASGPPGSLSNSPPASNSEKKAGGGQGATQERNQSVKNYEVGKSVSYRKSKSANIESLSVAVVIDNEAQVDPKTNKMISKPLPQDKINKITELVKATIGFDEKRGDKVVVVNSAYIPPKEMTTTSIPLWNQPWFWDMVKKMVGMTLGFVFLFFLYRKLSRQAKAAATASSEGLLSLDDGSNFNITPEMQQIKQDQINRLKELASRDPTRVALIIKNWIGK